MVLSKAIALGRDMVTRGEKDVETIIRAMKELIDKEPLAKIDYVEIVDWRTLENVTVIEGPILAAMAVYIGKTRLIDNFIME